MTRQEYLAAKAKMYALAQPQTQSQSGMSSDQLAYLMAKAKAYAGSNNSQSSNGLESWQSQIARHSEYEQNIAKRMYEAMMGRPLTDSEGSESSSSSSSGSSDSSSSSKKDASGNPYTESELAKATKEYEMSNRSLEELMQAVNANAMKVADTYVRPDYTDVINPEILGVNDLSKLLGVEFTYDRDEIEKIYQDATQAALRSELNSGAERDYYSHLGAAQNTALDTIRQQYGQALAAGASKGMQAANMLSAILGTTQTANEEATDLAVAKQQLVNKYAQQMKQDTADALQYSNEMASSIGSLSHQLYNDMIQQKTAELSYNQGINTDYAGYEASKYTAAANLAASLAGVGAGVYNNNQSAMAAIQAAIETARGNQNAAQIAADANRDTAAITGRSNEAVANINKGNTGAGGMGSLASMFGSSSSSSGSDTSGMDPRMAYLMQKKAMYAQAGK